MIKLKISGIHRVSPSELLSDRLQKLVSLDIETTHPMINSTPFWKNATSLRKLTWRRETRTKDALPDVPTSLTYLKLKFSKPSKLRYFGAISTDVLSDLRSLKFLHVPELILTETPLPHQLTSLTIENAKSLPYLGQKDVPRRIPKLEFPGALRKLKCGRLELASVVSNLPTSIQELSIQVDIKRTPPNVEFLPPSVKKLTLRVWKPGWVEKPQTSEICDFSKVPSSVESIYGNGWKMEGVVRGIPATVRVIRLQKNLFYADQLSEIPSTTEVLLPSLTSKTDY
eukprot:TRINITY_DN5116_c1_g2_i1.p1 TRINITY_DN5116_c1_g2~~TRINITY_DN5116_c1_g2_i1.p1  ORF type:complete len:284 (+),score=30.22 TRINITY_DN5116_c1_g2_i1:3-854(+)